jgi:hypothetical protein
MTASFFGGAFFGGEFFNSGAAPGATAVTGAGSVRKRRWALIGERMYHADDEEIRTLLDAYVAPEKKIEVPAVESKPPKKKRTEPKKIAVEVPEVIPAEFSADFVKYKRMYDDYMAQQLLEAILRRQDEDDIEVLLLH